MVHEGRVNQGRVNEGVGEAMGNKAMTSEGRYGKREEGRERKRWEIMEEGVEEMSKNK